MTTIEANLAQFAAENGWSEIADKPDVKTIYYAGFSQGWLAAIECLRAPLEAMHAEVRALRHDAAPGAGRA